MLSLAEMGSYCPNQNVTKTVLLTRSCVTRKQFMTILLSLSNSRLAYELVKFPNNANKLSNKKVIYLQHKVFTLRAKMQKKAQNYYVQQLMLHVTCQFE